MMRFSPFLFQCFLIFPFFFCFLPTFSFDFDNVVIVEKLLRVTDVEHIYLLIRNKKGKDVYTRIDELFDDPVSVFIIYQSCCVVYAPVFQLFALLKSQKPKYRHNISVISGDVSLPGMGIGHEERQTIRDNVNVVIHGAATVRFDEKLKMAIAINVNGTKEIIKLCREIKDLKVNIFSASQREVMM